MLDIMNKKNSRLTFQDFRQPKSALIPLLLIVCFCGKSFAESALPPRWNATLAGEQVMDRLVTVTAPEVKGAHDAEMVIVDNFAYIVAECSDERSGESAGWPEIYASLSIVNIKNLKLEEFIPFARGEQQFENEKLPVGACFVPRIIQLDKNTLRCFFASEDPGNRQSQTWYRDFDLRSRSFSDQIFKVKLKTRAGVYDMQPQYFHADAVADDYSFRKPAKDYGLYIFDSFKRFDGKLYVAINNWVGKQNALATLNDEMDTFEDRKSVV